MSDDLVKQAVQAFEMFGTKQAAAEHLGIPRTTLNSRLERAAVQGRSASKKEVTAAESTKAELARSRKTIEKLEATIEKMRAVDKKRIFKPLREKGKKGDFIRVAIPDTHGMFVDQAAVNTMLGDLKSLDIGEVVYLGDHLDCGGFLAQHHVLNYQAELQYSYEQDVEAANQFLDSVEKTCDTKEKYYLEGNHCCLSPDHEVLTTDGWKPIEDVKTTDTVASMNDDGVIQWDTPLATHSYDFDGSLVVADSGMWKARMTPEHRVWYWSQNAKDLICKRAKSLLPKDSRRSNTYAIPVAASSGRQEFDISDSHLKLFAWVLTDGSLANGRVQIYQSKEPTLTEIRNLLIECDAEYTEQTRVRGEYLEAHEFNVTGHIKDLVVNLFGITGRPETSDKKIPSWVEELSDRQFEVFIETVIRADGSRPSTRKSSDTGAACIYGSEEFLDDLQAVTCTHGWCASKRVRTHKSIENNFSSNPEFWCLNVCKRNKRKVDNSDIKTEQYCGKVYCLTTRWDNFIIRHKGNVSVTGNSRVEKWIVTATLRNPADSRMLYKTLGPQSVLHVEDRHIRYIAQKDFHAGLKTRGTIKLGKCYFTHGTNASRHSSARHAQQFAGCVVHGHIHREQSDMIAPVAVGQVGAWCPGCLCTLQPMYRHTCPSNWTHGYAIQFVRADGEFLHLNIPIVDGKSFLGPLLDLIT